MQIHPCADPIDRLSLFCFDVKQGLFFLPALPGFSRSREGSSRSTVFDGFRDFQAEASMDIIQSFFDVPLSSTQLGTS